MGRSSLDAGSVGGGKMEDFLMPAPPGACGLAFPPVFRLFSACLPPPENTGPMYVHRNCDPSIATPQLRPRNSATQDPQPTTPPILHWIPSPSRGRVNDRVCTYSTVLRRLEGGKLFSDSPSYPSLWSCRHSVISIPHSPFSVFSVSPCQLNAETIRMRALSVSTPFSRPLDSRALPSSGF